MFRPSGALALLLGLAPAAASQTMYWTFGPDGGADIGDAVGASVALLPDGAGPGNPAVIIGAPNYSDGMTNGRVYVVDGKDASIILHIGSAVPGEHLGSAVTAVPDLNGDGRMDYAAGGAGTSAFEFGRIRVYSGKTGAVFYSNFGPQAGCKFGACIAGLGDVDGDGAGDILVGAPEWDGPGGLTDMNRGYAALYSGKTGSLIKEWKGQHDFDRLGTAVAGLGDLDYDGVDDFAIGVPGLEVGTTIQIVNAGACNVYSGATQQLLVAATGAGGDEGLGSSICLLGDRDNDGAFEFAAGGPGWSNGKGRVRVFEGPQATLQASITGLAGSQVADHFGSALAPGGDVDHDGHDDLIVTATREGTGLVGYALVISGASWSTYGNPIYGTANSGFGRNVASGLDLDGDEWSDAFFGAPDADTYGTNAGQVRGYRLVKEQDDLGFQGPGPTSLAAYGTPLYTGGHADLLIEGLPHFTPCYLLASLAQLDAPFKGGVLVPHPAAGLLMVLPGSLGTQKIEGLPGGGGPFDVFVQAFAKQPAAPKGWWISNAVKMEFEP
jgi:hypothetical protein